MANDQEFPDTSRGLSAVRATGALLRTLGGCAVVVRVPRDVAAAGDGIQLGLEGAITRDIAIFPVVIRHQRAGAGFERNRFELLIAPSSLASTSDVFDAASARAFFDSALGVIHNNKLMRIEGMIVEEFGGVPYLYRVVLAGN